MIADPLGLNEAAYAGPASIAISAAILILGRPAVIVSRRPHVEDDPKELWNINTSSWVTIPVAKALIQYKDSIAKFPNIKPGGDGPSQPDTDPDTTPSTLAASQG